MCLFLMVMLSIKQFGLPVLRKAAYLGWKDGLVAGGTFGSKNPVKEETTKITYWRISPMSLKWKSVDSWFYTSYTSSQINYRAILI